VLRGAGPHLRSINGNQPNLAQAGLGAEPEHVTEQARDRVLMSLPEARDRRVIRHLAGRDHAVGDVLDARSLDPSPMA